MTFIFRDRYSAEYDPDLKIFVVRNEKVCITKLALLVVTLVLIDFALEIDVILTKIHQIENRYTSFTSSATAAFMVPALYFVACVLLKKFVFLKYGICFVVGFFWIADVVARVVHSTCAHQLRHNDCHHGHFRVNQIFKPFSSAIFCQ